MVTASEVLSHPSFQVWAAMLAPFAVRFAAAWTVWMRKGGPWFPVVRDAGERIAASHDRGTVDPIRGGVQWVATAIVATVVVVPLRATIDALGNAVPVPAVCLGISVLVSLLWLFRRIHADDIAWREFRGKGGKEETPEIR
jgi:hypothetical protein